MKTPRAVTDEVLEFYRELSLLTRSSLPLPESIDALASGVARRDFRTALRSVAEETRRGAPLADALSSQPRYFPSFHAALIRAGEHAGALPEALHEVAEIAHRNRTMGLDFREIIAYPAVTIGFALSVLMLMMIYYLPDFGRDMGELLEAPLPPVSAALFAVSDIVSRHRVVAGTSWALILGGGLWLFSGTRGARNALQRILRHLPGTRQVVECLDLARVCGISSVLIARDTPMPDVMSIAASMTESPTLAEQLHGIARQCEQGHGWNDESAFANLPKTLALALRHTPEENLAREMEAMCEHYLDVATARAKKTGLLWQMGALLVMALLAGGVVITLFAPMIELYWRMTAPF